MVTRINDFFAASGKEKALLEFLRSVVSMIEGAPGCRRCELLVDRENRAHLVIVETWEDIASHQAAAGRIPPSQLAAVRPLLARPPEGRYYDAA